ncbi:hypothetical protein L083_4333 [Actinoplanes sp. N902-109]|nr:hypothetical protein L083_4333 [Actinoplanes sp. N902-109]
MTTSITSGRAADTEQLNPLLDQVRVARPDRAVRASVRTR